jgi:hypothetical protein
MPVILATQEAEIEKLKSKFSPDKSARPSLKSTGDVARVVECLHSKHEALSSKPSTAKKKNENHTLTKHR